MYEGGVRQCDYWLSGKNWNVTVAEAPVARWNIDAGFLAIVWGSKKATSEHQMSDTESG